MTTGIELAATGSSQNSLADESAHSNAGRQQLREQLKAQLVHGTFWLSVFESRREKTNCVPFPIHPWLAARVLSRPS